MNYVAHIHIGSHTKTHLVGNFLGDFVKGSQLQQLPFLIEQGIRLHRSVDVYTDSHPLIIQAKQYFPQDIRRMSGVILDIYFDYLLMKHWALFSTTPCNTIFTLFYQQLEAFSLPISKHFSQQSERLLTHRWLHKYIHFETCYHAFITIEKRLNQRISFADKAEYFLKQNAQQLESTFQQFYPDCLAHGLDFVQSYSTQP